MNKAKGSSPIYNAIAKALNTSKGNENFSNILCAVYRNFFCLTVGLIPINCFMVLVLLHQEGPMTITKISSRLCLSKQQMTPITYKLLMHGYAEKDVSSFDHRFVIMSITSKGEQLLRSHIENMRVRLGTRFSSAGEDTDERNI